MKLNCAWMGFGLLVAVACGGKSTSSNDSGTNSGGSSEGDADNDRDSASEGDTEINSGLAKDLIASEATESEVRSLCSARGLALVDVVGEVLCESLGENELWDHVLDESPGAGAPLCEEAVENCLASPAPLIEAYSDCDASEASACSATVGELENCYADLIEEMRRLMAERETSTCAEKETALRAQLEAAAASEDGSIEVSSGVEIEASTVGRCQGLSEECLEF